MNVVAKYDSLHSLTQEMPIYIEEVLDNPSYLTHDNHAQMRETGPGASFPCFMGFSPLAPFLPIGIREALLVL